MLLPESLQPWRPWLDWFAPDLALVLGELVQRLRPLLGAYRRTDSGDSLEPQGIDDLQRRGPYERLLLSEWAVADAVPDEFLRRAANGEHLFLAPRETASETPGAIVALFDTGPLQLGAPRLAHLALWILLARRASEADVRFLWGTVQEPGILVEGDSPEMLKRLLHARSLIPVTEEHWQAWREWVPDSALAKGEWWCVGKRHDQALFATHRVSVARSLQDETLDVLVREPRRERGLSLPLPPPEPAVRLLKGQFLVTANTEAHTSVSDKFSLKQPPYITFNGGRVVVAMLDRRVKSFQVPVNPEAPAKKQRVTQWTISSNLLGIAMTGKNLGGIFVSDNHLQFWQFKGFKVVPRPEPDKFAITPGLSQWRPCISLKGGQLHRIYALDNKGNLAFWTSRYGGNNIPDPSMTHLCQRNVLAVSQMDHGHLTYARSDGESRVVIGTADTRNVTDPAYVIPVRKTPKKVYFGGGNKLAAGIVNWTFEISSNEQKEFGKQAWQLYEGQRTGDLSSKLVEIPVSWEVCGLFRDASGAARLVVLYSDKKSLMLITETGSETVFTAPEKIATLSVSPSCGHVAMLTEQRRLMVYSLTHRALLLAVSSGKDERDE